MLKCKYCDNTQAAKFLCAKHYQQLQRHGKIRDKRVKNEISFEGNKVIMDLYDNHGNVKAMAIFTKEEYSKIKDHRWYLDHGSLRKSGGPDRFFISNILGKNVKIVKIKGTLNVDKLLNNIKKVNKEVSSSEIS